MFIDNLILIKAVFNNGLIGKIPDCTIGSHGLEWAGRTTPWRASELVWKIFVKIKSHDITDIRSVSTKHCFNSFQLFCSAFRASVPFLTTASLTFTACTQCLHVLTRSSHEVKDKSLFYYCFLLSRLTSINECQMHGWSQQVSHLLPLSHLYQPANSNIGGQMAGVSGFYQEP